MIRIFHYVNQFFGRVGGEEEAGIPPKIVNGPVGPGLLLERLLGGGGRVVGTVICGDSYFVENREKTVSEILYLLSLREFDVFLAGPAFNAGRYGLACGLICKNIQEKMGIPAVTGMFPDNPGVQIYRKHLFIIETASNVAGIGNAMSKMVALALKLLRGEPIRKPDEDGYIGRGLRITVRSERLASERAIEMLLRKMQGEGFQSEITLPGMDAVEPAPPVHRLSDAVIALVTEGGLVPKGNPDGLESARATRLAKYPLEELEKLGPAGFCSIHRGFDTTFINEDPNRLVPADVLRELERKGEIRGLHPFFFVTTGAATTPDNSARIGRKIAHELRSCGISAAIVTST